MARRLGLGIGLNRLRLADKSVFEPVTSIKWAGTSSPSLTLNEINLPVYTITWEGTSSPNLNVT